MMAVAMAALSPDSSAAMMRSQAASSSASNSFQRGGVTGVLVQQQQGRKDTAWRVTAQHGTAWHRHGTLGNQSVALCVCARCGAPAFWLLLNNAREALYCANLGPSMSCTPCFPRFSPPQNLQSASDKVSSPPPPQQRSRQSASREGGRALFLALMMVHTHLMLNSTASGWLDTFTSVSRVPSRQPSGTTTGCTPRPLPALPPPLPLLPLLLLAALPPPLLLLPLLGLSSVLLLLLPLAAGVSFCCWCFRMLCRGTTTQLSCLQQPRGVASGGRAHNSLSGSL